MSPATGHKIYIDGALAVSGAFFGNWPNPWANTLYLGGAPAGLNNFQGVIGHYQSSTSKQDPGPRALRRIAALPGWRTA